MEQLFSTQIMAKAKQNIGLCYQCKRCSAGCPVSDIMQHRNYEILRMVQLEQREAVLASNTAWVCVSCKTCSERCPNGIDTAKILDVIKEEALAAGIRLPEPKMAVFHLSFLEMVRQFGRVFELGMIGLYKLKTGTYLQDIGLGLKMVSRSKLNFLPHRIKGTGEMKRIFAQARGGKS